MFSRQINPKQYRCACRSNDRRFFRTSNNNISQWFRTRDYDRVGSEFTGRSSTRGGGVSLSGSFLRVDGFAIPSACRRNLCHDSIFPKSCCKNKPKSYFIPLSRGLSLSDSRRFYDSSFELYFSSFIYFDSDNTAFITMAHYDLVFD